MGKERKKYRQYDEKQVLVAIKMVTEQNMSMYRAAKQSGIPWSTLKDLLNRNSNQLPKLGRPFALTADLEVDSSAPLQSTIIRKREGLIADMEKLLVRWLKEDTQRGEDLSYRTLQAKAKNLFEEVKQLHGQVAQNETFHASRGWYSRFLSRLNWQTFGEQEYKVPPNIEVSRLEVIKSNKGHHKVIHLGFMYTKHKAMGDKIRWRCVQRSTHCKGSIFTSPDFREPRVTVNHNHVPDIDAVEFARCRTMIAERVNRFRIHPASEERPVEVKTEMLDVQDMMIPGPSSVDNFVELYLPRQRPSDWAVPQQAPPGTKQVMPPTPPPLKKSLPPASQPSPKPAIVKPAPSRPVSPPQPPPPPPEVCLRWNSYHSNMQATFPSLLNNEQFVDVTLACEGRSIKCHKMMLSACSSYFEELLSQNPCQHPIVLMKDLKFWEVQALVDFMYRGEVNVGQDKLPSLLAAAEALQIKGLAGPASTSSSHDEDSLPPSLPLSTEDYLDESASSPSSARRARKRRTLASMPTPQQNTVTPSRNPVGRPRLVRPSPQPSTSSYVASEPPLRRARRAEPIALPVGEIKVEPVDIDISNDSMGNDSMDPIDEGFDLKKNFEDGGTGEANDSSEQTDEPGGGGGGEDHEMTGSICDDNSALITGHDSDLEYGNNNGMTTEQADIGATDGQNSEIQGYSYTDGNDGGPGMSSSDINPSYPEVVLNPDNGSSDSILGHM